MLINFYILAAANSGAGDLIVAGLSEASSQLGHSTLPVSRRIVEVQPRLFPSELTIY